LWGNGLKKVRAANAGRKAPRYLGGCLAQRLRLALTERRYSNLTHYAVLGEINNRKNRRNRENRRQAAPVYGKERTGVCLA
jgi:hypothetical protein